MTLYTVYEIMGAMRIEVIETTDYTAAHNKLMEQGTGRRVLRERKVNVWKLSEVDSLLFADALLNPREISQRLKDIFTPTDTALEAMEQLGLTYTGE